MMNTSFFHNGFRAETANAFSLSCRSHRPASVGVRGTDGPRPVHHRCFQVSGRVNPWRRSTSELTSRGPRDLGPST
jgi:hypothetical protein